MALECSRQLLVGPDVQPWIRAVHPSCSAGYWTTCGYANSRIANSRTGRLADWTTRILDKLRTGQLADVTGDFACLVFVLLVASKTASCPVRDLSFPRVD